MNLSEDMAATAVAEPSTQVERKARIAINGLGRIVARSSREWMVDGYASSRI
jgi:hypothetical protein